MKVFLKELSISGIKNLSDNITITFGKKNINKREELKPYNIKAIYGPNGAGKTAIIHSFNILKGFLLMDNYLLDSYHKTYLTEITNKNSGKINIKIEFNKFLENKKPIIYTYQLILSKDKDFEVEKEYFSFRTSEYSNEQVLFESKFGEIINYSFSNESKKSTYNLLKTRSFLSILLRFYLDAFKNKESLIKNNDFNHLVSLFNLANDLVVVLDNEDKHLNLYYDNLSIHQLLDRVNEFSSAFSGMKSIVHPDKFHSEKSLEVYKNHNTKVTKFLKLFKPDIISIDLDIDKVYEQDNQNYYRVKDFINYGDYKIDIEFESMGIKKLYKLYDYIEALFKGKIVVIDELDSHINDNFLTKIIEFVYEYTNGQLIFTTHSISPMDTLRKRKNAIEFISISGLASTWTQVGNYSPSNYYKLGMIEGLPFNISSENILKVFANEE